MYRGVRARTGVGFSLSQPNECPVWTGASSRGVPPKVPPVQLHRSRTCHLWPTETLAWKIPPNARRGWGCQSRGQGLLESLLGPGKLSPIPRGAIGGLKNRQGLRAGTRDNVCSPLRCHLRSLTTPVASRSLHAYRLSTTGGTN